MGSHPKLTELHRGDAAATGSNGVDVNGMHVNFGTGKRNLRPHDWSAVSDNSDVKTGAPDINGQDVLARDFVLFANGGAGPSHAWVLSEELGLDGFVVPAAATAQSAFGTANSDLCFTTECPAYVRVPPGGQPSAEQLAQISAAIRSALAEVRNNLALATSNGNVRVARLLSIRYRGQTHHLDIALGTDAFDLSAFRDTIVRFEEQYETLFGRGAAFSNAGYEILSVRAVGTGALPPPALATKGEPLVFVKTRKVVFRDPHAPVEAAIYRTTFPESGATLDGPSIIEFPGQSVVVPPGARATADGFGNLHVRRLP